jgi:hypothetical protein
MTINSTNEYQDEIWDDIPPYAFIPLGTRGMEKILLRQCFLPPCGSSDPNTVHILTKEEVHEPIPQKKGEIVKEKYHIYCDICKTRFYLIFEKHIKPQVVGGVVSNAMNDNAINTAKSDRGIFMERVYATDEVGKDFGEIGWVQNN